MNPWHDIGVGENPPEKVTAVIEVPRGSKNKYELDKDSGMLRVDRVLYSSVHYPANYGFIPQTYCDDKDPLDVLVLGQYPVQPMCLMDVRPIGVMHMIDGGEADDKILAVHIDDPQWNHINDIDEVSAHVLKELTRFFEDYKILEHKEVSVKPFEGAAKAKQVLADAISLYKTTFPK